MTNEKRLIDANALITYFEERCAIASKDSEIESVYTLAALKCCIDLFEGFPTVDAVEVVHGRWEPRTDAIGFVRCSICSDCNIYDDWPDGKKWNYCPNCGAKMDGDGNDLVEVVRCRDCKHLNKDDDCDIHDEWLTRKPHDFCSCGERKDNG